MLSSLRSLVRYTVFASAAAGFCFACDSAAAQRVNGGIRQGNPVGGNRYTGISYYPGNGMPNGNPNMGNPYGYPNGGPGYGAPNGGPAQARQGMTRGRSYALWTGTGYNPEGSVRISNNFGNGLGQGGYGNTNSVDPRQPAMVGYGVQFPMYGSPFFLQQQQQQQQQMMFGGGMYGNPYGGNPYGGNPYVGNPYMNPSPFGNPMMNPFSFR